MPCTQPTQFHLGYLCVASLEPHLRTEPGVNPQHSSVCLHLFSSLSLPQSLTSPTLSSNSKGLEVRFDSLKSCSSPRPDLSQGAKREHGVKLPGSGPAVGFLQLRPSSHLCLGARHPVTIAISRNHVRLEGTFPKISPNCRSLAISFPW